MTVLRKNDDDSRREDHLYHGSEKGSELGHDDWGVYVCRFGKVYLFLERERRRERESFGKEGWWWAIRKARNYYGVAGVG